MNGNTLRMVGKWAQSRVASGEEPPWTYHKLQQLAEISLELAQGMDAAINLDTDTLPVEETAALPQAENIVQLESFRAAQNSGDVILPA